jgi:hypothetical protein
MRSFTSTSAICIYGVVFQYKQQHKRNLCSKFFLPHCTIYICNTYIHSHTHRKPYGRTIKRQKDEFWSSRSYWRRRLIFVLVLYVPSVFLVIALHFHFFIYFSTIYLCLLSFNTLLFFHLFIPRCPLFSKVYFSLSWLPSSRPYFIFLPYFISHWHVYVFRSSTISVSRINTPHRTTMFLLAPPHQIRVHCHPQVYKDTYC